MKIHYIQHVEYETPGVILNWVDENKHKLTSTKFYLNESLPNKYDFDLLIIMGGPMNIYDSAKYPYLKKEKLFITNVIKKGISVLGICLGAQLIADVLGAKIKANKQKEIGWFPIQIVENKSCSELNEILSINTPVFHWHGDTFEIPKGAERIAKSEVCNNQAFIYNKNVFALQYHLEMSESSLKELIKNGRDEMLEAPYIQTETEMFSNKNYFNLTKNKLYSLLGYIEKVSENFTK